MEKEDFWTHFLTQEELDRCYEYAERMAKGRAISSFKRNQKPANAGIFYPSKIGEYTIYKWLREQGFEVLHTPFRKSYKKFDSRDDFQIEGKPSGPSYPIKIEVKTQTRRAEPRVEDVCSTEVIKAGTLYLFVWHRRKEGSGTFVGWTYPDHFLVNAGHTWYGTYNPRFRGKYHKTNEFSILIKDLFPPQELLGWLMNKPWESRI